MPQQPIVGILEWFHFGDREHVERTLDALDSLGVRHLRTGVSWADWQRSDGRSWYEWLLPTVAERFDLLPCFNYTPPSLGVAQATNAPPERLEDYADFVTYMIELFGDHFEWVELWNEPDNYREWNAAFDPYHEKFAYMVGNAGKWARRMGKKTLLGGLAHGDPNFLSLLCDHGALQEFDAVGVHGFPFSFEFYWEGWTKRIERLRERLTYCGSDAEIWITETGYSTWRHDEQPQLAHFVDALDAPSERVYWYSLMDLDPDRATVDGFHSDEREYHFGIHKPGGHEKLLGRLWREHGLESLTRWHQITQRRTTGREKKRDTVIGGAGFVGVNVADALLAEGRPVTVYDNLSRPGVERNLQWLLDRHPDVRFVCGDVLDEHLLRQTVKQASSIYHFAAQVAVTTALDDPGHDFEVNARGTFNVLEASRRAGGVPVVFTSTNKVYGGLDDIDVMLDGDRYAPEDSDYAVYGVSEQRNLDFHSPYGCSKGTADQYVLDHARTMGVPGVVLRMSCIYGPHQCGTEDQGWVAHFSRAALGGETIALYGDGCQVRDILYVADLVKAMRLAMNNIHRLSGTPFNIGGGPANAVSLRQVLRQLENVVGHRIETRFGEWRCGDQRWYVSDHRRFTRATGWAPTVTPAVGLKKLVEWQKANMPARATVVTR